MKHGSPQSFLVRGNSKGMLNTRPPASGSSNGLDSRVEHA